MKEIERAQMNNVEPEEAAAAPTAVTPITAAATTDLVQEEPKNSTCKNCSHKLQGEKEEALTIREEKLKANLVTRLNRVEGQVRGIKGMIERDVYCNDVLNQIAAVQAALNSVSKLVLESHIRGCLVEKIQAGDDKIVDELLVTIGKML